MSRIAPTVVKQRRVFLPHYDINVPTRCEHGNDART